MSSSAKPPSPRITWGPTICGLPVSIVACLQAASRSRAGKSTAMSAAASRIVCQPVHRHRCADSALSTVSLRLRSAPLRSWPTNRHTMPGVQNPHWAAPWATNASDQRRRSCAVKPSTVVIVRPATRRSGVTHATRGASSMRTVQHPHWPWGLHPSFTDRTPRRSRKAPNRLPPSSSTLTSRPSSWNLMIRSMRLPPG